MRSERLLHIAFEATRFLEGALPEEALEHIVAIDPDATEDGAYIYIQADDTCVDNYLPAEVTALGCHVQVICRPVAKLEVH